MNHYSLNIKVVTALKQPWSGWKITLWCQLVTSTQYPSLDFVLIRMKKVSQYYLFFWTSLLHLLQLTIMCPFLGWKTYSVCQVKWLEWFRSHPRECLFTVFYLVFHFSYMFYHRVQFLVHGFSQYILVLLGSLSSDVGLNISCMLMTHSCIYHWILTMS